MNHYLINQKLHEFQDKLHILISLLHPNERSPLCIEILNSCLEKENLHTIKRPSVLIEPLSSDNRQYFSKQALTHYLHNQKLQKLDDYDVYFLINQLPPDQQTEFRLRALSSYLKNKNLHTIKNQPRLVENLSQEDRQFFLKKILHFHKDNQKLFKHNTLEIAIDFFSNVSKLVFFLTPEKFIQKINTFDEKYKKQLHMLYIRKIIQESDTPVEFSIFSKELLNHLSMENIVAIIEHIHESTDICGESMEKIRPLCQAYLMNYDQKLPLALPMEHFTDLFLSFIKKFTTETTFSIRNNDDPKTETITQFKDNTPEKIKLLYEQYNHTEIIDNTLMISRE